MQEEEFLAGLIGRTFARDTVGKDDGTVVMVETVLLLPGKEVGEQDKDEQDDSTIEADLAQRDAGQEEEHAQGTEAQHEEDDACNGPALGAEGVAEAAEPADEEYLLLGNDLVDSSGAGKLQVVADVAVAWTQEIGTLEPEQSLRDTVETEIAVTQVVEEFG